MHELALAEDILQKIKEKAKSKVSYAKVAIGQTRISHPAELEELFAMIAKGTLAEGAKLDIEIIPMRSVCGDCKTEFIPKTMRLDCASCGSTNIQLVSGNELIVRDLK